MKASLRDGGMGIALAPMLAAAASCSLAFSPDDLSRGSGGGVALPGDCTLTQEPKDNPACVDDRVGIFVSPLGDDANPGTKAQPVRTLGKAIQLANDKPRIYICEGEYNEAVTLDKAVSIFGGFTCGTWSFGKGATKLRAAPPAIPLKIDGIRTIPGGTTIADLDIEAASAAHATTVASGSSIAVFVTASGQVLFRRVRMTAGTGRRGVTLPTGKNYGDNAMDHPAGDAPSGVSGGRGGRVECTDKRSSEGGRGGSAAGGDTSGTRGSSAPNPITEPGRTGEGGTGGAACTAGLPGANGERGSIAWGAKTLGKLEPSGWTPASGEKGSNGLPGQGGGGGGATAGSTLGGSGGGAGGCGGAGGPGGDGGGSSFALLVYQSPVTLESCSLLAADGGDGARGADGEAAQPGATRGPVSLGTTGCQGGDGGNGASGGGGGGGAGGLSVGIAYVGPKPSRDPATGVVVGKAGAAGDQGNGGPPASNSTGAGKTGWQANEVDRDNAPSTAACELELVPPYKNGITSC
ncbi:DUF1565 domain-containing protein [Pendulispora albinea]|uniref:DUF1565 domain-containing protein n=1 Tax=Pendulispora albinea TaxID=2741071 RepID=UPI00374E16BA